MLQKRKRPDGSNQPSALPGMRIQLPPNEFGNGQKPLESHPPRPKGPLHFSPEVKEIFAAMRSAALKAAEIVRYQTDLKNARHGRFVEGPSPAAPRQLLAGFGHDVERLDQVLDVLEARILHSIAVLMAEANRRKTEEIKAAALAQQKAAHVEATQDMEITHDVINLASQAKDSPIPTNQPTPEGSEGKRPASTAPTVLSLSSSLVTEGQRQLSESEGSSGTSKPRLGRNFPLKLDLSGSALRQEFTTEVNVIDQNAPASPVTLAPKTGKPRADDPISAISLIGPHALDALSAATLSAHPSSVFSANTSIGGLPSSVDPSNSLTGMLSNFIGPMPSSTFEAQSAPEVIDLTQATPSFEQALTLPTTSAMEPIDLTMDSPTVPLAQLVKQPTAAQEKSSDPTVASQMDLGIPMDLDVENSAAEAGAVAGGLDNILSGFGGSEDVSSTADIPSGSENPPQNDAMPADATALLAQLTSDAKHDEALTESSLDQLGLGLAGFSDMADLSGGMPNDADNTTNVLQGLDPADMSMYLDQTFGAAQIPPDAGIDMFRDSEGLQGLMEGTGAGSLDLNAFLSGMGDHPPAS